MSLRNTELEVWGMTCATCVRRVEKALSKVPGVDSASVNYATSRATIQTSVEVTDQRLIEAIEKAGYRADSYEPTAPSQAAPDVYRGRLYLAVALTVPVVAISMLWHPRPEWVNWLLFGLTTPVTFGAGWPFFRTALNGVRHLSASMDTLIALGSGAAWMASTYALFAFRGHHQSEQVFFESSATIVTLILFGRALEERAKHKMGTAIQRLLSLVPPTALVRDDMGTEIVLPVRQVRLGDEIIVKPGDLIPVDGTVIEGTSFVDESMLTGESMPVGVSSGSKVTGGTLNKGGSFIFRAERVGKETMLSQIITMVERAQGSKANIQGLADRVSGLFVPFVILASIGTFLVWLLGIHASFESAILAAIAVVVIACPCALGLATPTALVVGMGRGAELGILVKDGPSLERAASIRYVLLDKTGTLTEGQPRVTGIEPIDIDKSRLIQLVGSIEKRSEHPIGHAISNSVANHLSVEEFEATEGMGVSGLVEGQLVKVGKASWLDVTPPQHALQSESLGNTVVYVTINNRFAGYISVADEVRETSRQAITELKKLHLEPVMVTGDASSVARQVASVVGITEIHAEVLPGQKAEIVEQYRSKANVAMVGDGVNDGPALALADLGIAMGSGSDVAIETAGITLLHADLKDVSTAIKLSRATLATIKGNLVWAFGYNVVMIPLAMSGKLSPMLAAAAMAFSSVSVVMNSLRLRGFRPDEPSSIH